MSPGPRATLSVVRDEVVVTGEATYSDRQARLFFSSVLGAVWSGNEWCCPRRHASLASLVVRINTFLERRGFTVLRLGLADREVERELERRRSFARTFDAAARWKAGDNVIDIGEVKRRLL